MLHCYVSYIWAQTFFASLFKCHVGCSNRITILVVWGSTLLTQRARVCTICTDNALYEVGLSNIGLSTMLFKLVKFYHLAIFHTTNEAQKLLLGSSCIIADTLTASYSWNCHLITTYDNKYAHVHKAILYIPSINHRTVNQIVLSERLTKHCVQLSTVVCHIPMKVWWNVSVIASSGSSSLSSSGLFTFMRNFLVC